MGFWSYPQLIKQKQKHVFIEGMFFQSRSKTLNKKNLDYRVHLMDKQQIVKANIES